MKRDRKEKFSIRKFSFGAASCLIGAQIAISGVTNTVKADGIIAYEANGDKVTAYAHGESVYKLRGTSTSIYNAFLMDVDTSKYTKENPIIKVTLTYNAKDNQTGSAPIFWSGRPMHWFTVPEATEELGRDYKLSLTNGSGNTTEFSDWRSWESNSRFIHSKYKGNPDAWERYNTTTTEMLRKTPFVSLNSEFNKVLGDNNNRWYDNSNMPTQDIMRDLRAKSNSIYIDWEKRAAGTVTVSYTTKVKDPEKTKEITIGMGVYQPFNAQQYARVETIKLPVLYKLNEVFEPKEPERTAVENITNLKDDEIAIIREKIWAANLNNTSTLLSTNNAFKDNLKDSSNSGANSIVIDRTTGKATITYKDDTTDTIEGSNLIYKKPEPPKPVTPSEGPKEDKEQNLNYNTNPIEVESLDNISQTDRDNALKSFLKVNLTQEGYNKFENGDTAFTNNDFKPGVKFNLENGKRATFILDRKLNYIRIARERPSGTLGIVPKDHLFKAKAKPAFDINAAKEEANKLIESLDNLYPNEKLGYKAIIANATDRDSIEIEVNKAKAKANENAVELAKMKKEANDKINGLNYLTKEERENAINKINSATIKQGDNNVDSAATNDKRDIDANRDDTRDRLNSVVNELVQQNLQKARQKAIETINSIPNEDLSPDKKTDYINKINAASKIGPASEEGTILNIVEKAQKEASAKEAARKKEEADKVRQQYKDMIANIPGLTDEEKTEYNKAIDAANNVGEMESIVEYAKLTGERKKAIAELGKLDYLNNAQKQAFTDAINGSATKAELDYYVSQATQLNSKMKQLHDLAAEARKIKPENGAPQDKYTSAAAEKQTAFNNALADAERVLNKATGADEAITSVGKLFTALETAINELKPSEKVTIPADKSALKAEYDKGDSVKNSPAYTKETNPDKKKAYDDALKEAKKVLDATDATQDAVDKALEDLEVAKAGLNGKQDEFALSKKDENAVAISIEPVKGEIVSKREDKALILGKIDGIPTGAQVVYNPIVEKDNKKYVPVKVTHENVSKEIEIEVVQSVASKVTPTTDTAKLSETPVKDSKVTKAEDVQKVKKAVKVPEGTQVTDKKLLDEGKVVEGTDQSANGGANNAGKLVVKVEVTYGDGSKDVVEVPVEASDAAKATPKVKEEITSGEVPVSVDPTKATKVTEQKDKDAITDAVEVPKDQPQPTNKQVKNDGEIVGGTGANVGKKVVVVEVTYPDGSKDEIEVPVRKATDKEKAKSDLTDAANTEKGEIGGDTTLTDKEKEDLKAKVDEVKKAAEDKIDKAKTPEEIAKATEEGKKAIADVYNPQTSKGKSTSIFKPELDLQTALVSGKATVEKGKDLTDEEILKQLALADGVTAKITSKPTTTETGTKEAEVEVTLADGTKVTVKVPVEVVESLEKADKDNDLAKAKEDAKKQVEEAVKKKLDEIKKDKDLTAEQKQKAEEAITKAKDDANKAIDEASSAGTAKQIADEAKENIEKYNPKADTEVKKPDVTNLDGEKAKAKAEVLEEAQKRINEIKNNKDVSDEEKQKAIDAINKAKDKAIEDINKGQSKDEIDAAKDNGIKKINEVQPEGSIASKFEPKVPENKVEVKNPTKLSDEEKEKVRQNIEGVNTFPDGTTVDVKPDGTAVITYKDGSSDTISKDKLVAPAKKDEGTIASRTEPVIPGKTQVGNTTKLTPEEQAAVKKAVEDANKFPAGTTVEVRPDGTVVITYPDKSVDTITGDKLVEKGSKQTIPKVKTEAEKNPAQVPGRLTPVENTHSLTPAEQSAVATKVKQANPTATDVKVSKDGTATLTYGDGSVNTIPGTSLVVAKDTDKEVATQAAQNPAVAPATTEVGNTHNLTPEEQAAVATKVKATNPTATDVKVSKDGTATLTYGDGSVNTIPGTSLVIQKEEVATPDQPTIAEKTKVIIPANPTKVVEATRLTDEEKEAVRKAVAEANGFGSDVKVEVAGDGTATIVFPDGSAITIPGTRLVAQDPKAQDSNKTDAEKTTVKAPAQRVDVKDITHLTDEEKEKVKVAILQANGSALDGVTIEVAGDGTATITFPDGSVATILGKDTVQQSAKTEPAIHEKPEYTPESTPDQDNGGNTGRLDDNANSGNGSNAGTANAGDNNASKEDAKGGIQGALAKTGLDNPGGLAGLGLAMLGGLLVARRRKEK